VAAVSWEDDGLAPFGHLVSRAALKSKMAHDLALAIARDHWDELATLDLVSVAMGREHVGMDIGVAVHGKKAAGDGRRIISLGHVDFVCTQAACSGSGRWLLGHGLGRWEPFEQAAVNRDFPSIDAPLTPGDPCIGPHATTQAIRDRRKPSMPGQGETVADLLSRAQDLKADAVRA